MKTTDIHIHEADHDIPAILWGDPTEKLLIAVHGMMSHKTDTVIQELAQIASEKGWRVLSFDLPEHGDRTGNPYPLDPDHAILDLQAVYRYAETLSSRIALFGCSLGAYMSLIAFPDKPLTQVLFLSPVVNMEAMIRGMMAAFHVDDDRLEREQVIELPFPPPLSWSYLQQVLTHPIQPSWTCQINILYGTADETVPWAQVSEFAKQHHAEVELQEGGEHFFHTEVQLQAYRRWLNMTLE